jgi:hypothetical protein
MGVSPENLGFFDVKLRIMKRLSGQLAAAYATTPMAALVSKEPLKNTASPQTSVTRDFWSARKIDAASLKKNGIAFNRVEGLNRWGEWKKEAEVQLFAGICDFHLAC